MVSKCQIPEQIAEAIIANRHYFHELNAKAQATNANNPAVQFGFVTRPLEPEAEQEFWTIEDDETLDDFLVEDLLGALYGSDDIDWNVMPSGYEPLLLVLEFERHSAFEGWTAVSNKGEEEMREIIAAYEELGLVDEAVALKAVTVAYVKLANDDHPDFHDILGAAYRSVSNRTPEPEDRAPLIWAYVRNNPGLFCVSHHA